MSWKGLKAGGEEVTPLHKGLAQLFIRDVSLPVTSIAITDFSPQGTEIFS
jgi:hypothetical protein